MITSLPYSTAEIISATAPRTATGNGVVEKKVDNGVYVISLAGGSLTVKVSSGSLTEGEAVSVTRHGNELLLQRIPSTENGTVTHPKDVVDVQSQTDTAILKPIVDAVVEQLKNRVLDKSTLDQVHKIIIAVAKAPQNFGEEILQAIGDLKKIVSTVPSSAEQVSQVASEITDRIIVIAERLDKQLKVTGGEVDVVLKPDSRSKEGYYKFDSVKSAIAWIVENKEVSAAIPWQKLSQTFKEGPVVLQVYESAIGDVRASLVSPDKVEAEMEHFVASTLKADIWKSAGGQILARLLIDRKEIPLERLLEIDKLLTSCEQTRTTEAINVAKEIPKTALLSKGFETAFCQWLAVALEKGSPLAELVPRAPAAGAQQLTDMLLQVEMARKDAGIVFAKPVSEESYYLQKDSVIKAQQAETVVPELFKRLGLNLESVLSKGNNIALPDSTTPSLKVLVLSFLRAIDSIKENPPTSETGVGDFGDEPPLQASSTQNHARTENVRKAQSYVQVAIANAAQQIFESMNNIQSDTERLFKELDGFSLPVATDKSQKDNLTDKFMQFLQKIAVRLSDMAELIKNSPGAAAAEIAAGINKISEEVALPATSPESRFVVNNYRSKVTPDVRPFLDKEAKEVFRQINDLANNAGKQISARIKAVADAIQDLVKVALTGQQRLSMERPVFAAGQIKNQTEFDFLIKDIVKQLDTLGRSVASQAGQVTQEAIKHLDDLAVQTSRLTEKFLQDAESQGEKSPLDHLKQQVENVLTRVESMQVLAKQVSLADTQQQVINLPMKIEGQWTDVVIKFLKKKGSQKKETTKKEVSIAIHVSPSLLGEISVFMDYRGKKSFAMRMEFERPESRQWFESNRAEFSRAIEAIGFSTFSIDMRENSRNMPKSVVQQQASKAAGVVDIKA